jgi:hypothetical protein
METLFSLNITGYQQGSPSAFVNIWTISSPE